MAYNREFEINEEQIADYLSNAANRVKTTENVDILSDLNKLFKKNVPLSLRKYVIAYMLKESLKHYHSFRSSRNDDSRRNSRIKSNYKNNPRVERKPEENKFAETTTEERPHHERVIIPEDKAVSIFIGIGKNRRVYPRDIVGILISVGGLERNRIGDIKVLANYSFVQLYAEDADQAINKLNGYDYRGRKLSVSYSHQKSDEEDSDDISIKTDFSSDSQLSAEEMAREDAEAYAAAEKAAANKEPFGSN